MNHLQDFKNRLFSVNKENFERFALELFQFQAKNNVVYNNYITNLKVVASEIKSVHQIPFLPIDFFKTRRIATGTWKEQLFFESSGTTLQVKSRHYIEDVEFYHTVSRCAFEAVYGPPEDFQFLALLPSYLERNNSSLVLMMDHFIKRSKYTRSGFYLHNFQSLITALQHAQKEGIKIVLIGVTFGLLELAEKYKLNLKGTTVMETGGMKGRREEMVREDVHEILKNNFEISEVHSEYGMTELLSQAYATKGGRFFAPPWVKISIRDFYDPFEINLINRSGGINIIDLANVHSCAFIETKDIGIAQPDGSFQVLGRFDNSEVRGCNLMLF